MYHKNAPNTIEALFADIASTYDTTNAWLSLGLHKKWNAQLRKAMGSLKDKHLLDLCAGTGEISLPLLAKEPKALATLLDFCAPMLDVAQKKMTQQKICDKRVKFVVGDAQELPFESNTYDAATIAYGIRNVKEPLRCLKEVHRVLVKGGRLGILELTRPPSRLVHLGHKLYLRTFLPTLGALLARNKGAYKYLASSIGSFAAPSVLKEQMHKAGFCSVETIKLTLGTATIFIGEK